MTPQQLKAMKLALEALELLTDTEQSFGALDYGDNAITAIKEALAQPEQEPVAWMDADGNVSDNNDHKCFPIPLYTHPPQRTWVGLTDEEIKALVSWWPSYDQMPALMVLAADIQNSLKEKNT